MLNLRKLLADYHSTNSYTELIPWMCLIEPGLVLNTDGSLLANYTFEGVDVEGLLTTDSDRYAQIFEQALRTCNENITLWATMDRRRSKGYPEDRFESPVSSKINEWWKETVEGKQYTNKNYLSLLYKPSRGTEGFFDGASSHLRTGKYSFAGALLEELKISLSKKYAVSKILEKTESMKLAFRSKLREFEDTITDLGLKRLANGELLTFLHSRCNPATSDQHVEMPLKSVGFLNSWLPDNALEPGHDYLKFDHVKPKYVAAFSIKDWPNAASPGILDTILQIPCELTVSQCFRFIRQDKAKSYIEDAEAHFRDSTKSLMAKVAELLTKQPTDREDTGQLVLAEDAQQAMAGLTALKRYYGYYNLTVLVYADSPQELDRNSQMVSQALRHQGFIVITEKINLLSAFTQTLPGQHNIGFRWAFLNIANVADMAMLRTVTEGSEVCHHLTEQTRRPQNALTVFPTEFSTPYYFNLFETDLGHMLTIGPTGSGKTTLMAFLISQFGKYHPCNRVIFDKDFSCQNSTLLQGGKHINMDVRQNVKVKMNPLLVLKEQGNVNWLISWLKLLICARGYQLQAQDDATLLEAVKLMMQQPSQTWCLTTLSQFIKDANLRTQLGLWLTGGIYGAYFDNFEDEFQLSSFVCIEMGGLLGNEELGGPFMDYAFFQVNKMLDGRPTLIYIEEAWFMLANEMFTSKIDDWLRTLRKKNAAVVMATQSLNEIARSEIFMTLIDSMPTRLFLPNPNAYAHRDLYEQKFGLNEEQIRRIANAVPKQQYYVVTSKLSRMLEARFPREIMSCLAADERSRATFRRHYADGHGVENWELDYIKERANA